MKKIGKIIGLGILTWLIPFIVSIFFYAKTGELLIDIFLFKSIMIIVGVLSGSYLLVIYFKNITSNYLKEGWLVGLTWLIINYVLDILILLPMAKMDLNEWFLGIGLRYLSLLIISIMMSWSIENSKKSSNV